MAKADTENGTLLDLGGGVYQITFSDGYVPTSGCPFINGVAQLDFTETDPAAGIWTFDADVFASVDPAKDVVAFVYDAPCDVITAILEGPIVGYLGGSQRLQGQLGRRAIRGQVGKGATLQGRIGRVSLRGQLGAAQRLQGVIKCP